MSTAHPNSAQGETIARAADATREQQAVSRGSQTPIKILYTNWRGVTAVREIVPGAPARAFWFGSTEWHPEPQWLLCARDVTGDEGRDFALSGIKAWGAEAVDAALSASPAQPQDAAPALGEEIKIHGGRVLPDGRSEASFIWPWGALNVPQTCRLSRSLSPAQVAPVDGGGDLVSYLMRQWSWSKETFGPALRTKGVVQHITKELREIEAKPHDLSEWVDVIILAMDGFWRHGGKPEDLLPAMQAKQDKNFARSWPDWRTMGEDQAIEHDRSGETVLSNTPASAGDGDLRAAAQALLSACVEDMGYGDETGDYPDPDDEPVGRSAEKPCAVQFGHLRRLRAALARPAPQAPAASAGGEKPVDPVRMLKDALFACLKDDGRNREYGGVLAHADGRKAWVRFTVEPAALAPTAKPDPAGREEIARIIRDKVFANMQAHDWIEAGIEAATDAILAARPVAEGVSGESFQARVMAHMQHVMGDDSTDLPERRDRHAEEDAELLQSLGLTREAHHKIIDYVHDRPVGEPSQEMGGTLHTLAGLAGYANLDMIACGETELARCWQPEVVAKIRRKRANRHGRGPLPGNDADLITSPATAPATPSEGER